MNSHHQHQPQSGIKKPDEVNLKDLEADVFSTQAENWAKYVALTPSPEKQRGVRTKKDMPKATQVRRFYDEVVKWHNNTRGLGEDSFKQKLPFIRMLSAMVTYSNARDHSNAAFSEMVHHTVKQITDYQTLSNFKHFFEAFVGYYKLHGKDY
jgi:CRISPR-associated protein Csm2